MRRAGRLLFPLGMAACMIGLIIFLNAIQASGKVSDASIDDVSAAVLATVDADDASEMLVGDNSMVKRLYGLDPSAYEGVVLYYPNGAGVANEMLIVKLSSIDQQGGVKEAIGARLDTEKTNFNGYGVGQYEMLQQSITDISGNYVLFIVSHDPKAADAAFQGAL